MFKGYNIIKFGNKFIILSNIGTTFITIFTFLFEIIFFRNLKDSYMDKLYSSVAIVTSLFIILILFKKWSYIN
jgi:hypothetical protein